MFLSYEHEDLCLNSPNTHKGWICNLSVYMSSSLLGTCEAETRESSEAHGPASMVYTPKKQETISKQNGRQTCRFLLPRGMLANDPERTRGAEAREQGLDGPQALLEGQTSEIRFKETRQLYSRGEEKI